MAITINKSRVVLLIIVLLIAVVVALVYFNMNSKGIESYIETFRKNQNLFEKVSTSLMQLDYEMNFLKESDNIIIRQNGISIDISKSSLDTEIKSSIKRAINDLGLRGINKTKTSLEFVYNSNKDMHSIVFTTDKDLLIGYTNVEHLIGNWYYGYIFNE